MPVKSRRLGAPAVPPAPSTQEAGPDRVTDLDVAPDVAPDLEALMERKYELDAADSALSQLVAVLEQALGKLRLGVPISVTIHEGQTGDVEYLGYEKVNTKWRLVIGHGDPIDDEWTITPLSDVSRERRALILDEDVPRLVKEAAAQLARKTEQRKRISVQTAALANEINKWSDAYLAVNKDGGAK
jgi:hypothetical protein